MYQNNLTAEQRITKARITLMRDLRFVAMAGIMMTGTWKVKDNPKLTAMTNGRSEVYGREFVSNLTDRQLVFLVAHECYHKMLRHRWVWKSLKMKNPELANCAMDFVINGMLDNTAGAKTPSDQAQIMEFIPGGCLDHKYDGMDTLQVFKLLQQQQQQQQGGGSGKPTDNHDFDDNEEDEEDKLTPEEEQALSQQIDQALRQGMIQAGKSGGKTSREFGELLDARIRWEDELRDFITTTCKGRDESTWRRPNRRYMSRDIYLPSPFSEVVDEIVIGIDTSGSIGGHEIKCFLSEVKAACNAVMPRKVHLMYWDDGVASHEIYEGDEVQRLTESTKPKGGGGTDIGKFFAHIKKQKLNPACIICFTDGYTPWPEPGVSAPILMCITTNVVPPYGRHLKVEI